MCRRCSIPGNFLSVPDVSPGVLFPFEGFLLGDGAPTACAACLLPDGRRPHTRGLCIMKRMLINATQTERTAPGDRGRTKLLDYGSDRARTAQRATSTRPLVSASSLRWKPVSSTTAKTATASRPFKISRQYFAPVSRPARRASTKSSGRPGTAGPGRKRERGQQGRHLTTFISLAGRYVVLDARSNPARRRFAPHRGRRPRRTLEGDDQLGIPEPACPIIAHRRHRPHRARTAVGPELPVEIVERHRRRHQGAARAPS